MRFIATADSMKNVEELMIRHPLGVVLASIGTWLFSLIESSIPVLQWLLLLLSIILTAVTIVVKFKKDIFSKEKPDRS